jgi:GxxExxY protein
MKSSEQPLKFTGRLVPDYLNPLTTNVFAGNSRCAALLLNASTDYLCNIKGIRLDCGYRIDVLVADLVVVEIKAVEGLAAVHDAQLLTYLRLGGWRVGLLINFNVVVLKEGIHRRVL